MKFISTFSLIVLLYMLGNSQSARNANWLIGYPPNIEEDSFGGAFLKFADNSLDISYFEAPTVLLSHSFLNSKKGELICYTDGCKVFNNRHEIITNGDSINYSSFDDYWANCSSLGGYGTWQGQLLLPIENKPKEYVLLHLRRQEHKQNMDFLFTRIVDKNGELKVTQKNILIETLENTRTGYINACKHANGQDWWVIIPRSKEGRLLIYLFNDLGITLHFDQNIGHVSDELASANQIVFSPDGTKFAKAGTNNGVDLFEFDRCEGFFFNSTHIEKAFSGSSIGMSFSPNSKLLYASSRNDLWQFDLSTEGKINEPIHIDTYNGYLDPLQTSFYQSKLAPNNKIYIGSTNTVKSMHVINEPNRKGKQCNFVQNSVKLPVRHTYTLPNSPLFRVGPIDGSICDSLGLNSTPVAKYYHYATDSIDGNYLFTNASYFGPSDYYWDFDDGYRSFEFEPNHTFTKSGTYEVCLTASNNHASDIFCRTITIELLNEPNEPEPDLSLLYPNPISTGPLNLILPKLFDEQLIFEIFTVSGQFISEIKLDANAFNHFLNIDDLQNNMYFYRIKKSSDGSRLYGGKFLVSD